MNLDNIKLLPAKDGEDAEYFLSCLERDILLSVSDIERKFSETWIDGMMSIIKNAYEKKIHKDEVFVLKDGAENIGVLWLGKARELFTAEDVGYIYGIFVEEKYRNLGLGKELIKFAEEWCEENGLLTLSLNVGVPNTKAMDFYKHCGFEPQSIVMRKFLR